MTLRFAFLLLILFPGFKKVGAQCSTGITSFPYSESFETSNGGWVSGGTGSDWAWGAPIKPVINAAGSGTKCWVIGGLTGSSYTNAEASWIQSPCLNFTGIQHPYISFKVFWEMEQQFDGGSLQYSLDNGASWNLVGSANDPINCLNANWFNNSSINYLSPLTSSKHGWSGNVQTSTGSCRGGNGSGGWVIAKHTMPYLAGEPGVLFRFIFGAGTICNNYDGFAVDDIFIGEAALNNAAFTHTCTNATTVEFTNTSALCPTSTWNFGDAASGANNTSASVNPAHVFSGPGTYTVTLTVSGPGNAPSTITHDVTIIGLSTTMMTAADCINNTGGSVMVQVTGPNLLYNYSWNTSPVQNTQIATNLGAGPYIATVSAPGVCTASTTGLVETDLSCIGVFFPSAFTPDGNGKNDGFGPLGSLSSISNYRLRIYNRWGGLVFYSTNPFEKWTGLVKGLKTDSNIFVWYAEFDTPIKAKDFRKGTITLIR